MIRDFFRRGRELPEELSAHIEERVADLVESGVPEQEARQQARREFGNPTRYLERSREVWAWARLSEFVQDLRYALRQMRRSPGFTLVAVLSLALGIGANAAIFSVLDALLLKALPVKQPDRLVTFIMPSPDGGFEVFQYPLAEQLRVRTNAFSQLSEIALIDRSNVAVSSPNGSMGDVDAGQVTVSLVSGNYFAMLGVDALIGRTFTPDDDRIHGGHPVAIVSYGYWERRLALAGDVVGRSLKLNGTIYSILGVTPHGFAGDAVGNPTDIWIPIAMQSQVQPERPGLLDNPNAPWVRIVARLKPGMTTEQAHADAAEAFYQIERERPGQENRTRESIGELGFEPAARGYSRQRRLYREPLEILMIIVGIVLLIACANVANLLLARSAARRREMAVRLSLGAGRARLLRQLLTESILLACCAGALALLLGHWGTTILAGMAEGDLNLDLHVDARVLLFTAGVSLLTGLIFGLAPAWSSSSVRPSPALKGETGGAKGRFPVGKLLVVIQVALSLVLLIGSGLFVRTLTNLKSQDFGFDRQHVWMIRVAVNQTGRQGASIAEVFKTTQQRVGTLPGVISVGPSAFGLMSGMGGGSPVTVPGYTRRKDDDRFVSWNLVSPQFFDAVGMKLIAGRNLSERDNENSPDVAVINESMARHYFGRSDPVGKSFGLRGGAEGSEIEIVGVVKDAKYNTPRESPMSMIYLPYRQDLFHLFSMCVAVRTVGNLPGLTARIRDEFRAIDPALPILSIDSMEQDVDKTLVQERIIAFLSAFFGGLAVVLACIGLFGVMSYTAARRTSEIGVRLALGATRLDVLLMVLKESLLLVAIGIALGVPATLAATHGIESLLFGIRAGDPATIGGAALLMIAVGIAAAYIPARRASCVDPLVALRHE
jgi:predicted permease